MALTLKDVRKVAVVGYDPDVIRGSQVSLQVAGEEKRTVSRNEKHEGNLFFPLDFHGEVEVTAEGSKSGSEKGKVSL